MRWPAAGSGGYAMSSSLAVLLQPFLPSADHALGEADQRFVKHTRRGAQPATIRVLGDLGRPTARCAEITLPVHGPTGSSSPAAV